MILLRRIQNLHATGHEAPAAIWLAGSRFRGLETYRFEHASIFFGRSSLALLSRLTLLSSLW